MSPCVSPSPSPPSSMNTAAPLTLTGEYSKISSQNEVEELVRFIEFTVHFKIDIMKLSFPRGPEEEIFGSCQPPAPPGSPHSFLPLSNHLSFLFHLSFSILFQKFLMHAYLSSTVCTSCPFSSFSLSPFFPFASFGAFLLVSFPVIQYFFIVSPYMFIFAGFSLSCIFPFFSSSLPVSRITFLPPPPPRSPGHRFIRLTHSLPCLLYSRLCCPCSSLPSLPLSPQPSPSSSPLLLLLPSLCDYFQSSTDLSSHQN